MNFSQSAIYPNGPFERIGVGSNMVFENSQIDNPFLIIREEDPALEDAKQTPVMPEGKYRSRIADIQNNHDDDEEESNRVESSTQRIETEISFN